jgi:hypothetical protein
VAEHFLDHGVFVRARDVLDNIPDAVGLGSVKMLDEAGDLDEGFAARVFGPLVFACIRVQLARRSGDTYVDAFGEGVEGGWVDAARIEGEAAVPADEG